MVDFRARVWAHYREHGRHELPWRLTRDPYAVLVSEVMLQQTQVARVVPKYETFLAEFPTLDSLAAAPLEAVLRAWQGLGYNRRALWLKRAAEVLSECSGGEVPHELDELEKLPGVGRATAAGVLAFAFGKPAPYLETNVRTAYLHDFFPGHDAVPDRVIAPILEASMDRENPREWFYALLDYGSWLKSEYPNPSRRSAHHARQSRFEGSWRQKRARALRAVLDEPGLSTVELEDRVEPSETGDLAALLAELESEGFVVHTDTGWAIA